MKRDPILLTVLAIALSGAASCREEQSPPSGRPSPGRAGGSGDDRDDPDGNGASSTYVPADVNHVLGTGQSLSLGAMGTPALSRTQPYDNQMFDTGLTPRAAMPTSFVPLIETDTFMEQPVETPSSSMANLVTKLARETYFAGHATGPRSHDLLVSLHGLSGGSYPMICKGTESYSRGLAQVRAAKLIADTAGKTYVVRAVTAVHGESDGWQNWNGDYDKALVEWQHDYETDIKSITGQSIDVPMFHTQYSAWSAVETSPSSIIPFLQLEAHKRAPGKVVVVGPKYVFPYASDGLHLTNEGYRWLGEYYAKAYVRHVIEGKAWEPLRPKQVTRSGKAIVLSFIVPAPPLTIDTERVSNPGNFGFEVSDPGTQITHVAVTAPDTVTLSLSAEPPAGTRVRYAYSVKSGRVGGPEDGPRGNLRDSDDTPSQYGYKLFNWSVHFDEPIP